MLGRGKFSGFDSPHSVRSKVLGAVVLACNSSIQEAEAGGLPQVWNTGNFRPATARMKLFPKINNKKDKSPVNKPIGLPQIFFLVPGLIRVPIRSQIQQAADAVLRDQSQGGSTSQSPVPPKTTDTRGCRSPRFLQNKALPFLPHVPCTPGWEGRPERHRLHGVLLRLGHRVASLR